MSALAHDLIELSYGPVTPILSKATRTAFVAAPGKKLVYGDFSNVEGRVCAWVTNEQWKLDAFRAFDAGRGPDLYKVAYGKSFDVSPEAVIAAQRQIGKTMELSFQFQGSIGAWLRFDPNPEKVTKLVKEQFYGTPQWMKAAGQYDAATKRYGLTPDQWISIKLTVNSWRDAHPNCTQSWWEIQDGAIEAVGAPDTIVPVMGGRVRYLASEGFLWCRLPSGKLLAYAKPRLVERREDFLVDADGEIYPAEEFAADELAARIAAGGTLLEGRSKMQVVFEGKNQKTNAWGHQYLYGGLQMNNIVQGTARELLRCSMETVELFGYEIVLHVHDELVTEVDRAFGSATELESLMSIIPEWAKGLPLATKAHESQRYTK